MSMRNPLTPAGIETATFRFVAQHLNHCDTAVLFDTQYEKKRQKAYNGFKQLQLWNCRCLKLQLQLVQNYLLETSPFCTRAVCPNVLSARTVQHTYTHLALQSLNIYQRVLQTLLHTANRKKNATGRSTVPVSSTLRLTIHCRKQ